ncbi:MAG: RNA methyltransferase [Prevotellaceae bacterium]|jgi:TrmH family RNA methyltransferase|nr:RNA methyltransferase [Prevotellaceae bacterium]
MLSKNKIKDLTRLSQKKYRDEAGVFVAEGNKLVEELLAVFRCQLLAATPEWLRQNTEKIKKNTEIVEVSPDELKRISQHPAPQQVFAVFEKPDYRLDDENFTQKLTLALDDIQDPGNLGTILRIADWFGIDSVICSLHCADVFNSKTIQASMGAIARVKVFVVDLPEFLSRQKNDLAIIGTFLDGDNIYTETLPANGIIVMGNEGKGISPEVEQHINRRLFIPSFPPERPTSESLNVAVATAVVCAEFRRPK